MYVFICKLKLKFKMKFVTTKEKTYIRGVTGTLIPTFQSLDCNYGKM